jgi:AmiR/NasT family two-component response regulator
MADAVPPLRVVIADETPQVLAALAERVRALGHEPVAEETTIDGTATAVEHHDPQLVLVGVHDDPEHALDLLEVLSDAAGCPVIVALDGEDADFVADAARRGVTAYAASDGEEALRSAVEIACRRFADMLSLDARVRDLEARQEQRAILERAKGVLMNQHDVDEPEAYAMLRDHARRTQRRLGEVAAAVLVARGLLLRRPDPDEVS